MKCFTVTNGEVYAGIKVDQVTAKSGDTYQAIVLGHEGRGRSESVTPVRRAAQLERIEYAQIGATASGKPAVIASSADNDFTEALIAFRTTIGFRGSNSHTGSRERATGNSSPFEPKYSFRPFPGKIIATGVIAQGTAGLMGSGDQILAIVPKGTMFRVTRSGRLYGAEGVHYGYFDGQTVKLYTPEDAENLDIDLFAEFAL